MRRSRRCARCGCASFAHIGAAVPTSRLRASSPCARSAERGRSPMALRPPARSSSPTASTSRRSMRGVRATPLDPRSAAGLGSASWADSCRSEDIVTLIRACSLALQVVEVDVRIFGPIDEDPHYARRCRRLVAKLGLEGAIRFEASRPVERIYPEIDMLVLTELQRRAAARHSRGQRRGDSGDRLRCRRVSRAARGAG